MSPRACEKKKTRRFVFGDDFDVNVDDEPDGSRWKKKKDDDDSKQERTMTSRERHADASSMNDFRLKRNKIARTFQINKHITLKWSLPHCTCVIKTLDFLEIAARLYGKSHRSALAG